MILRQRWHWQPLLLGGYLLLCAILALHLHLYPSQVQGADALEYIDYALDMRADGFLGQIEPWRTYGYPWFIYICSLLFGTDRQTLTWGVVFVQATLYAAVVFSLAAQIVGRSRPLAQGIGIGLLLNPILVALVMDTLTEGLTLITAVLLLTILLRAASVPRFASKLPWLISGSILASFSMMIRPANLALLLAWNAAVFPVLLDSTIRLKLRALLVYAVITAAISAIVWTPQLMISARQTGHASIFPAALGDFQIIMGLKLLKYATLVKADHVVTGMFYPNPWLGKIPDTQPWHWYFSHPAAGAITVASHVFNALNYDHPFVYIYEVSLPWSVPLAPICWAIYALAVLDVTAGISRRREFRVEHPEVVPVALFLAVMTAVSLALISVSAVESRFSTLIFASASVFACHCVLRIRGMSKPRRSRIVATSTIVAVVGMLTSEWMKTLSMPS